MLIIFFNGLIIAATHIPTSVITIKNSVDVTVVNTVYYQNNL